MALYLPVKKACQGVRRPFSLSALKTFGVGVPGLTGKLPMRQNSLKSLKQVGRSHNLYIQPKR